MKKKSGGIWIEKNYKKHYSDSRMQGLRLVFQKNIPSDRVGEIKKYVNYLRKNYFFPIRCKVHFCYQESFLSQDRKKDVYGLFLFDENDEKLPEIYVPVLEKGSVCDVEDIIFKLTILLTYYFQWYFFQNTERSSRSLEIEATKYAKYLTYQFANSSWITK